MSRAKQLSEKELRRLLNEFCEAYRIQKNVDLDDIELCHYTEANGRKEVYYFRKRGTKNEKDSKKGIVSGSDDNLERH